MDDKEYFIQRINFLEKRLFILESHIRGLIDSMKFIAKSSKIPFEMEVPYEIEKLLPSEAERREEEQTNGERN